MFSWFRAAVLKRCPDLCCCSDGQMSALHSLYVESEAKPHFVLGLRPLVLQPVESVGSDIQVKTSSAV